MSDKNLIYCASYIAVVRDNKVFLLLRQNTGYRDGYWNMPAGHIEADEFPEQAAVREAREEVGVEIAANDLEFGVTNFRFARGSRPRTYADFLFIARKFIGEPRNLEGDKASEGAWFDLDNLPENIVATQRQMLADYKAGKGFASVEEHTG